MKLIEGNYYFTAGFLDADLTIPIVTTIKYLSEDQTEQGENVLLFEKIDFSSNGERMFVRPNDVDELVMTKRSLIDLLQQSLDGTLASP